MLSCFKFWRPASVYLLLLLHLISLAFLPFNRHMFPMLIPLREGLSLLLVSLMRSETLLSSRNFLFASSTCREADGGGMGVSGGAGDEEKGEGDGE